MMGKTHGVSGLTLWVVGSTMISLPPEDVVLGGILTMGASILPDIDHPNSTVSRSLGILSRGFSWLVSHIAGGHRKGTHSLIGVIILGILAFGTTVVGWGWIWVWCMLLSMLVLIGKDRGLTIGLMSAILTAFWYYMDDPGLLPAVCLVSGTVIHILGDMLTHGGCPIFYPKKQRYSLGLFKTNSPVEKVLLVIMTGITVFFLGISFGIW